VESPEVRNPGQRIISPVRAATEEGIVLGIAPLSSAFCASPPCIHSSTGFTVPGPRSPALEGSGLAGLIL